VKPFAKSQESCRGNRDTGRNANVADHRIGAKQVRQHAGNRRRRRESPDCPVPFSGEYGNDAGIRSETRCENKRGTDNGRSTGGLDDGPSGSAEQPGNR
jgi:hypothetical protein